MYKIAIDLPDLVGQNLSFFMCTSSNCNNRTIDKTINLTFTSIPNSFGTSQKNLVIKKYYLKEIKIFQSNNVILFRLV